MRKERAANPVKGQGSVSLRRRSPLWQNSYWDGWRQARESSGTTDYAEAVKSRQRKLGCLAIAKSAGAERTRVAALLELLYEDYRWHDRAELQEAPQYVNRLLKPNSWNLRASAFTPEAVNTYIRLRQSPGRQNATINRELALLRRGFRLGHEHDRRLAFRLPIIKGRPEDNVREGFLESNGYRLILDPFRQEIKPVFVIAYHLGMRTGELLAIKRSWVDLHAGLMYVNGRVTKNRNFKTAPVYGDMRPGLEMLLSPSAAESPKCLWLFSRKIDPIKDFKPDCAQASRKAGVPGLLFHDLRRTPVRNLIRAGVPEKIAMQISGHKTASMLWLYEITDARDIKDAGKLTERYLEVQKGQQYVHLHTPNISPSVA